jgi:hypothetical protein
MELIRCKSPELWDQFVDESPQKSIFCKTQFLDALCVGYQTYFLYKDSKPILGVVFINEAVNGEKAPFTGNLYQGLLFTAPKKSSIQGGIVFNLKAVESLLEIIKDNYESIELCLHHSFIDLRAFQWVNYHTPTEGRFVIDIGYTGVIYLDKGNNFSQYIDVIRSSRRQDYKKSIKNGFLAEECYSSSVFLDLYQKTFARQDLKADELFMQTASRIMDAAIKGNFGRLCVSYTNDGLPASASFFLYDDENAYYLLGATDPAFRNYGVGTHAILENIRYIIDEKKIYKVDMLGMNSPNRGDYKTSFNATLLPYYSVRWDRQHSNNMPHQIL